MRYHAEIVEAGRTIYVYVIQILTGPIKVGVATNVANRLAGIRISNPYDPRVIHSRPGSLAEEQAIHSMLNRYAICGEWFVDAPTVRKLLDDHFGTALPYRESKCAMAFHKIWNWDACEAIEPSPPARPRGIKVVRRRLADGTLKEYAYERQPRVLDCTEF